MAVPINPSLMGFNIYEKMGSNQYNIITWENIRTIIVYLMVSSLGDEYRRLSSVHDLYTYI